MSPDIVKHLEELEWISHWQQCRLQEETHLGPGSLGSNALVLQVGIGHHDHLLPRGPLESGRVFLRRQQQDCLLTVPPSTYVETKNPQPASGVFKHLGVNIVRSCHTRSASRSTTCAGRTGLRSGRVSLIGKGRSSSSRRSASSSSAAGARRGVATLTLESGRRIGLIVLLQLLLGLSERHHLCRVAGKRVETELSKVHAQASQRRRIAEAKTELVESRASLILAVLVEHGRGRSLAVRRMRVFALTRDVSAGGATGSGSAVLSGIFKSDLVGSELQVGKVQSRRQAIVPAVVEDGGKWRVDHARPARVVEQRRNGRL